MQQGGTCRDHMPHPRYTESAAQPKSYTCFRSAEGGQGVPTYLKATGIDLSTLTLTQRSANADKGNFVRGTHLPSEKPRQLTMVALCPCMPHNGRYSYAYRLDGVLLMYC
jgi:hypothetical protein